MPVKLSMNRNWSRDIQRGLNVGLLSLVTDIDARSKVLAPRDTGALVNSARIDQIQNGYKVTYGSSRVPYARIRHFENKRNPQTTGYLAKAAESVIRGNLGKHWSNI